MDFIDSYFLSIIMGSIGILLLLLFFLRSSGTKKNKQLEDELCSLFFDQHAFLISNKNKFFEFEKVKELLFFGKKKLFEEVLSNTIKENYLTLGRKDLQYVQDLLKKS